EIVSSMGMKTVREGCLSVPEYTANIRRAEEVTVKGLDGEGREIKIESSGFEAVALQHELDHLDGILFIDRIDSIRSLFKRKVQMPS
ncbi:MAG: peptide deformylase, partial [Thermodesulfobacteriota bacterium]